jgi:hypothetical protein
MPDFAEIQDLNSLDRDKKLSISVVLRTLREAGEGHGCCR